MRTELWFGFLLKRFVLNVSALCSHGSAAADRRLRRLLLLVLRHPEGLPGRLLPLLLPAALCVPLHLPGHPEDSLRPPQANQDDSANLFQEDGPAEPPAGSAAAAAQELLLDPCQSPADGGNAGGLPPAPLVSLLRGGHGAAPVQRLQADQRAAELCLAPGTLQLADQPSGVCLLAEGAALAAGGHVLPLHVQDVGCRETRASVCVHGSCFLNAGRFVGPDHEQGREKGPVCWAN